MQKKILALVTAIFLAFSSTLPAFAISDSNTTNLGGNKNKRLQANAWIETTATSIGNSNRWEYQISAKYLDNASDVEWIKTEWYAYAKIRKSTTISLGVSSDSMKKVTVTASASTSWQLKQTPKAYWKNGNGKNISDWRDTLVINSRINYLAGSKGITNNASIKVVGDPKYYSVSATV